jgi:CYTH domain
MRYVMHDTLEREDKWDVDERFVVPRLDKIVANADVDRDTVDMTTVYYDTPDHDLQAHGIVLQRREGDANPGWHLEIPGSGGRTELHWMLTDDLPNEIITLLRGVSLGKSIDSIATIRTARERYRISVPKRRRLRADVTDDRVRASVGDRLLVWREIGWKTACVRRQSESDSTGAYVPRVPDRRGTRRSSRTSHQPIRRRPQWAGRHAR